LRVCNFGGMGKGCRSGAGRENVAKSHMRCGGGKGGVIMGGISKS